MSARTTFQALSPGFTGQDRAAVVDRLRKYSLDQIRAAVAERIRSDPKLFLENEFPSDELVQFGLHMVVHGTGETSEFLMDAWRLGVDYNVAEGLGRDADHLESLCANIVGFELFGWLVDSYGREAGLQ